MNQYVDNFFNYHLDNFYRMAAAKEIVAILIVCIIMNVIMYFIGRRDALKGLCRHE